MTDSTPATAAIRAQPFRHKVQLVQAWRCTACGGLFHPDWPSDSEACPAHVTATRVLIGHFYDEARARHLASQFVELGHPAERFAVERDQFGEWLVYDKGNDHGE